MSLSVAVIGDTHFKTKQVLEGQRFITACLEQVEAMQPDLIVLLGDILHTHEIVHIQPHNLVYRFIERLVEIAETFILIGNHDYINNTQFLTDAHIFNPFKHWENLTIVDRPIIRTFDDQTLIFCPYVPPGRFIEALETTGDLWELANCIFAHQEFRNCSLTPSTTSTQGDVWSTDYPPVISGHIHKAQNLDCGVFYPGSPIQHHFEDETEKRIWKVVFGEPSELSDYFSVEKVDLGIKTKRVIRINIESIDQLDIQELVERYSIKLSISGTPEQFKVFRSSELYRTFKELGIKFAYKPIMLDEDTVKFTREQLSYEEVLKRVIATKPAEVQESYQRLLGE